jgi:NitT/TauT family transport system ATP-binding protein
VTTNLRLTARKLSVKYHNGIEAIHDLTLEVKTGEFVVILGPSGCGKTTLLDVFAGLIDRRQAAISGDVFIDGIDILADDERLRKLRIGYVFERNALLPWRTVVENVELGLLIEGMDKPSRRIRSHELLDMIGLDEFENYYPHELSAGMKQRVSFARTLAYNPDIIFMDEPFGALDTETRLKLQAALLQVWEQTQVTILLVTHDVAEAVTLGDRIVLLSKRPARTRNTFQIHAPHPRNPYEIRTSKEFAELTRLVWQQLAKELKPS